jgi:hypothetical protein
MTLMTILISTVGVLICAIPVPIDSKHSIDYSTGVSVGGLRASTKGQSGELLGHPVSLQYNYSELIHCIAGCPPPWVRENN